MAIAAAAAVKPVLLEYAGISFAAYSLMMAVGLSLFFVRSAKDSKLFHLDQRLTMGVLIAACMTGWLGARLFFTFEHRALLQGPWWAWVATPNFGGFSSYGGVIGGIAGAAVGARLAGMSILQLLDTASVGGSLLGAVGRVGCFLAGCCHGTPVEWGVVFPPGSLAAQQYGESVAVHPTQLYEAAAFAIIAVCLVRSRFETSGERFCWLMISYGSVRLLLSIFRGDALIPHGILGPAQWISLFVFVLATCLLFAIRRYSWRTAP